MTLFTDFQLWAQTYAKLFMVLSAAIVLFSWLIETLWTKGLEELKTDLEIIQRERREAERFNILAGRLLEIYQTTVTTRDEMLIINGSSDQFILKNTIYITNRLGHLDVRREAIMNAIYYADALRERVNNISLSGGTKQKLIHDYESLLEIIKEIDIAKKKYQEQQTAITGHANRINADSLNEDQIKAILSALHVYENFVNKIEGRYVEVASDMYVDYQFIAKEVRNKIKVIEQNHKIVRYAQIVVFLIGTLLSIYGAYLDATSEKTANIMYQPNPSISTRNNSMPLSSFQHSNFTAPKIT